MINCPVVFGQCWDKLCTNVVIKCSLQKNRLQKYWEFIFDINIFYNVCLDKSRICPKTLCRLAGTSCLWYKQKSHKSLKSCSYPGLTDFGPKIQPDCHKMAQMSYFLTSFKMFCHSDNNRPRGLLVSSSYGTSSHIKGYSNLSCSYAQWYCKWVSAAVRYSYCAWTT